MFIRTQSNGSRTYLLIVDNKRVDGKVMQRVLFRLGRLDQLLASGQFDSLVQSLVRFSDELDVLGAYARGESIATRSAGIGTGSTRNQYRRRIDENIRRQVWPRLGCVEAGIADHVWSVKELPRYPLRVLFKAQENPPDSGLLVFLICRV